MSSAAALRIQIEESLATRFPAALSPMSRTIREAAATGIAAVDALLDGGLPVGAISEVVGPECSGRTTLSLAFVASCTAHGQVCAWVDACDALDPESATASGVYLPLLLWIRCTNSSAALPMTKNRRAKKSWSHLDQALRATDLLLQVGGFATLARIKAMVGEDRVGTPVLEDSNRPASFHLDPFCADAASKSHTAPLERTALRRVRPPRTLEMMLAADGRPGFFRDLYDSFRVTAAYGPWRTSGAWWSVDAWDQEKWDVMARDSRGQTLCFLLVHDLLRTEWRLEALLD